MSDGIRIIKPGDIGWIISQHGLIYSKEFKFDSRFEVDIARKVVALCKKEDGFTRIWIKEVGGVNAGSIAVSKRGKATVFINFLLVINRYRGRGIAQELMNHALGYAKSAGFQKIRLETYSCLTIARKIYATFGFRISGPIKRLNRYGQSFDQEFWELHL